MIGARGWRIALPLVLGGLIVGQAGFAGAAGADSNLCGSTLTASITLTKDLRCSGDGLRIGAAAVVIDLAGHSIVGSGTGIGVNVAFPAESVTITNGTVRGFSTDIYILTYVSPETQTAVNTTLSGLTLDDATEAVEWIPVGGSLVIDASRVSSPIKTHSGAGRPFFDVSNSRFTDAQFNLASFASSRFVNNVFVGGGIRGNNNTGLVTITDNRFTGSSEAVQMSYTDQSLISRNRFVNNGIGLSVSAAFYLGNTITDNVFVGNGIGALIGDVHHPTDISGNTFQDNGATGLWLNGGGQVTVTNNRFIGNGFAPGGWVDENGAVLNDGAHIWNGYFTQVSVSVSDNVAIGNAGNGIEAINVTDGGGNQARGNGDAQCVGVLCEQHPQA